MLNRRISSSSGREEKHFPLDKLQFSTKSFQFRIFIYTKKKIETEQNS